MIPTTPAWRLSHELSDYRGARYRTTMDACGPYAEASGAASQSQDPMIVP